MRVHSEDLGEGATAWRLLPPLTLEQPAPTPAPLETEEGESVPTLLPGSPQAARLPALPTDDGAASSRHDDSPTSQGMNTLPPTRLDGAGLRCDVQPDGSLQFVMRDDPRNECAPPGGSGAVIGLVGSGVGVQLCVNLTPSQVEAKTCQPVCPLLASQVWRATRARRRAHSAYPE